MKRFQALKTLLPVKTWYRVDGNAGQSSGHIVEVGMDGDRYYYLGYSPTVPPNATVHLIMEHVPNAKMLEEAFKRCAVGVDTVSPKLFDALRGNVRVALAVTLKDNQLEFGELKWPTDYGNA